MVTKDDPRYDAWSPRKQSKATRKKKLLREDPVTYAQTFGREAVQRQAATSIRRTTISAARQLAKKAAPLSAGIAVRAAAIPALGAVGLMAAAGILGGWLMDKAWEPGQNKLIGELVEELSLAFVQAQREMMRRSGALTWMQVPAGPRDKLVAEYQAAISAASTRPTMYRLQHPKGK